MKLSLKIKRASYFYESLIIIADSLHNDYANITRIKNCKTIAILRTRQFSLFPGIHPSRNGARDTKWRACKTMQARHLKETARTSERTAPSASPNAHLVTQLQRGETQRAAPQATRTPQSPLGNYTSATHRPCRLQYS